MKKLKVEDRGGWNNEKYSKAWHRAHGGAWEADWKLIETRLRRETTGLLSVVGAKILYNFSDGHEARSIEKMLSKMKKKQISLIVRLLKNPSEKIMHLPIDFAKKIIKIDREEYHLTSKEYFLLLSGDKKIARYVVNQFARRKEVKENLFNSTDNKFFVSIQDSLDAGNCEKETNATYQKIKNLLGAVGEVGAVRADFLLSVRDDVYTRRACAVAAQRRP